MSLVSLTEAKSAAQIYHSREDAFLQILLDGVEQQVSRLCGVYFSPTALSNVTEYCDGGGTRLWPTRRPIVSLASVTDRETDTVLSSMEATKNSIYHASDPDFRFERGSRRYSVVYMGGYTPSTLPSGLKIAILHLFVRMYRNRGGRATESGAGHSIAWQTMDQDIAALLRPYTFNPPIW